ncbi:MAG: DNA topoisomerase IV subunit A [Lentisphaeria bacterium]|nr:DNA topoisomerase IV subunit A [Lentisphaeria bacterium]
MALANDDNQNQPTAAAGHEETSGTESSERHDENQAQVSGNSESGPPSDHGVCGELASKEGNDSLGDMMAVNFLEYASYVIKERAIPDVVDGMKPVQRRILHSLWEMDDGRFHKVANVIGHTMRYHPHGDASIGNALVVLANKDFFIDRQGNFGNIYTGDDASAPRYIECRLTPLAKDVLFNRELTDFIDSYDGRNQEPVGFPAKVPALLMMGSDGIAVGMATRIMPHNFTELLQAQIAILQGRDAKVYPDFLTGGLMDASDYEDGNGRLKVRAAIETVDDKTLVIREIPATVTTEKLMTSIIRASQRGKIKIASVNDYTAEDVEIEIKLPRGTHADDCLKQLFAYTDCECGISCSLTVIKNNRPEIMTVTQVLKDSTEQLVRILNLELELELRKLEDRFHDKTLAQIFIENRIYKRIEECPSYEDVMAEVHAGLEPFKDRLKRAVSDEDVEKLLGIQIRRISLFDINKNREELEAILEQIKTVKHHLTHVTEYAIEYVKGLVKKYGHLYPRRTTISDLETVDVKEVALANVRVGHDRMGHFVGSDVKNSNKNEEVLTCTEFDRLVLLKSDGQFKVIPIPEKVYVGPVKFVLKADKSQVYSMIYRDKKTGKYYAKRFKISSYIMEKEYKTLPKNCIIEGFYTNYGVVLRCEFKHKSANADDYVDVDFNDIQLRSSGARGFKISDRPIGNIIQLKRGSQTPDGEEEDEPDTPSDEGGNAGGGAPVPPVKGTDDGGKSNEAIYEPHLDPDMKQLGLLDESRGALTGETAKEGGMSRPPDDDMGKSAKAKSSKAPEKKVKKAVKAEKPAKVEKPLKPEKPDKIEKAEEEGKGVETVPVEKVEKPAPRKPRSEKDSRRTVIDEETPFFLE